MIDNATLLTAIAFSSAALMLAMLISWLNTRSDSYLVSWAMGMALIVVSLAVLGLRNGRYDIALQITAFAPLIAGMALVQLGAYRFATSSNRLAPSLWLGFIALSSMTLVFLLGFSGPATVILNAWCALFMALSAYHYWGARQEAPLPMIASVILFGLTGLSFLACSILLLIEGEMVLLTPPNNWAEQFNSIMAIVGLTGLGALALTLNQSRITRRHRNEAQTDAMTGLLNRRALFERLQAQEIAPHTAVLMFDIDHFKQINDQRGHGAGDVVIQHFGIIMQRGVREQDIIARIGGEEFCAVLPGMALESAYAVAERIRNDFDNHPARMVSETLRATVSAGVATSAMGETFSTVLSRADAALYAAKRGGRNRVNRDAPRHAY
ncbi:MAG: GGDEF domain-containing protein [Devosia sp.]